jgi:hypothetical protein
LDTLRLPQLYRSINWERLAQHSELRHTNPSLKSSPSSPRELYNNIRSECSLHPHIHQAQHQRDPPAHTTRPESYAILTESTSTLQTSTASKDNSLFAPPRCALAPSTKCLPTPPSMHQTSRHSNIPSLCLRTLPRPQHQSPSPHAPSKPPSRHNLTSI